MNEFNLYSTAHEDLTNVKVNIGLLPLITLAGPNSWDDVTTDDFGPEHDFDIEDHGSIVVLDCYSNAALQWCYRHLPEDCPRWGRTGFAIERRYVADVINGMSRDRLMSRKEFTDAMSELNELARQWEDQ